MFVIEGGNLNTSVTISLAQIPVSKGDVKANLEQHLYMIERASSSQADVVVFPELSLTGYELELLAELAVPPESSHFQTLSQAAVDHDIVVIAGCPLKPEQAGKPTIGAVICFPDGTVQFYVKQSLHAGEEVYCSSGETDYCFHIKGYQIALAVCADFADPQHAQRAKAAGADIYVVSALISEHGFVPDGKILSQTATEHGFPVFLSNHISVTGGWDTCGRNAVWNSHGELVLSSETKDSCLVLGTVTGNQIEAAKI
ncbi:carbon-nitrogen hydrolase family protein [Vibrio gazogenes]|uniref:Carbon-nitrogen hydrolase family protein n=1 Tax=Vibrio gazogenes TaxID=687 RepID=A0A1Z2SKM4_VIBGA|nr:carbon-nitrogen hydrolase family protein [Vibrio gazogenes]